jgi:receptor expression-enhancing protein 5/6
MADFVNQLQSTLKGLDTKFASNKLLTHFENQTKLPRSYAILSSGAFYFILIFINIGGIGQLLSNIAGFVIPGYLSLQALGTANTKDDTELLTYWVVFAFLNVIEFWSKAILYWIPFYWFLKTVFLLYLSLPQFGGAQIVYKAVIKPIADQYILTDKTAAFGQKIDDVADAVASGAKTHSI